MKQQQQYSAGDIVFIFYQYSSIQQVVNIQEAAVVNNPDNPKELALFLFETYYPLTDDMLIFTSEMDAEQAYHQYFH
ncbi:transcriptional regulator SplA domain-containing protein [Lysinibacillus sp. NPDC095746]|uniref:transcriptional regulator SplA domain-containing protein n=1 Tax=Lysinibacillus sp. NPDC095746 TaxID=3364134 RepID=UPI0038296173